MVQVYVEEGESARTERIDRRPKLVALLRDAKGDLFDIVAVHTIDRWSRDVGLQRQALLMLGDAGIGFASVMEDFDFTTPGGKLLLTMICGVAEFFSDQPGVHVSKDRRYRASAGMQVGPVPFGYHTIEPGAVPQLDRNRAALVREVFRRRSMGESTGAIANWINSQGFKTRKGGIFTSHAVKDMEIDGIEVSIVYPTVGLLLFSVEDGNLLNDVFSIYNDWLAEFCQPFPDRLKGVAMINVDDVNVGVKEMERCAKMGLRAGMITVYPPEWRGYDGAEYEPLWAAAQDLQMPLGLHIVTNRIGPGQQFSVGEDRISNKPSFLANADHWVRISIADMIFSGVFERYPKLQVGSVEMELSWAPHFLDRIDYQYTQRADSIEGGYKFKGDVLPSDFFHNNVFLGFQEDSLGIELRDRIGVDQLLWGGDYPHQESTFPRSRQIIEEILADCTEEEKAKIAGGNAVRVYNLN